MSFSFDVIDFTFAILFEDQNMQIKNVCECVYTLSCRAVLSLVLQNGMIDSFDPRDGF